MPPFLESARYWATATGGHFLLMFWWIWPVAVAVTALGESVLARRQIKRLSECPDDGWRTLADAAQLALSSPPSRARIFAQARVLLARGITPRAVVTYLVVAQSLMVWMICAIVMLNGPQPLIGQVVAVTVGLAVLLYGVGRIPGRLWARARRTAESMVGNQVLAHPLDRAGPVWKRFVRSVAGQVYSLSWPLLFGVLGVGVVLALGQSPAYVSLQGSKGALVQAGNAVAGLALGYVTGAPLIGNAFLAAGLWKAEFITYSGLVTFYLATLVMPFALPRYFALFGVDLSKRLLLWLVSAIIAGGLAATAWWWGLDALAGLLHVRDWFEMFTASTLRPNDVPWFHHWFAPNL